LPRQQLSALNHRPSSCGTVAWRSRNQEVLTMIRNRRLRRGMALGLVVVGAVLLLMAPSVHYGLAAFGLGVVLELAGIAIERREPR
jgi:hypothetical protein